MNLTEHSNELNDTVPSGDKASFSFSDLTLTEWVTSIAILCVFFLGVFGNLYVIAVFGYRKRRTRSRYESLLLTLATADLCCSLFTPVMFAYGTITRYKRWDFGWLGCKTILAVLPINVTISHGILLLISYERYRSVTMPLKQKMPTSKLVTWIGISVVAAVIMASPYIYALEVVKDPLNAVNTCISPGEKTDAVFVYSVINLLRDVIASALMAIMSIRISKGLTRNSLSCTVKKKELSRTASYKRLKKMLAIIVGLFSICVIPVDIFQVGLYSSYYVVEHLKPNVFAIILKVNTFLSILQASNSALSVIVYAKMHRDFRALRKWLFCCFFTVKKKKSSRLIMDDENHNVQGTNV